MRRVGEAQPSPTRSWVRGCAETEEVAPGIMLDFDSDGRVIGVEVLNVSERMMKPKATA